MADGTVIDAVEPMLGKFIHELTPKLKPWQDRLQNDSQSFSQIENELQQEFSRGAGMIAVGLLGAVMSCKEFLDCAHRTRAGFAYPLKAGQNRKIKFQMLGGFVVWLCSLYCAPGRGLFRKSRPGASGVHIELVQFGMSTTVSPEVENRIARQSALCSSFALAHEQLERDGLNADIKFVRRVALNCGQRLLHFRTDLIQQWRAGKMPVGVELAGKRVTVQIDGGRTRVRSKMQPKAAEVEQRDEDGLLTNDAPGRSRAKAKRTFEADWREPKLVTIFEHDEQGRMLKKSKATIDGTLEGPDAIAELVAMHLHRLGGAKAQSITFAGDGATWIWNRIDGIIKAAKIPASVKIHQVLDNCHATHHISLALKAMGTTDKEHMSLYRELRTKLRNGQWREVVEVLEDLAQADPAQRTIKTEIEYLRRHGEAGRLAYPHFRAIGIPLGSGAVESSIRRVINLRIKSNAMYWCQENAESMMQLRALVVSQRWDERTAAMRMRACSEQLDDWHWTPQNYDPSGIEPNSSNFKRPNKTLDRT